MSFESFKARKNSTTRIIDELNKLDNSRKRTEDDRFWKATVDKVGNGFAIIRFLPSRTEDNLPIPFVKVFDHGFQGPTGRWYIENSLTTINKDDPVSELNSKLWNSGSEDNKEIARKQKRRLHYVGNILVVKDPAKPENEGKVFLYKFGPKIYNKIKDAINPPENFDEEPIVPFDFWEGANFRLKIRKVEGYPNYDASQFDSPAPISEDEAEIEKIYNQINLLTPFIDPDGKDADGNPYFKSYDELKKKLYQVLDLTPEGDTKQELQPQERASLAEAETDTRATVTARVVDEPAAATESAPWMDDSGDDSLEFFKSLITKD